MNGVNVADCWVLPRGTTAVEMTLGVTNATQVCRALSSTSSSFSPKTIRNTYLRGGYHLTLEEYCS